jgi:urease accessory protein
MGANYLLAGILHPLGGADHALAMVAIGLWSAIAGGRALWAWPLAFVSTVLAGFAAAMLGMQVLLVEPAIAASIVVLGLFVVFAVRAPVWLGAVIAALFAFFHGHAHGTEAVAADVEPVAFAVGFALTTAALHALGLALGLLIARTAHNSLLRAAGGLVAMGGVALVAGLA